MSMAYAVWAPRHHTAERLLFYSLIRLHRSSSTSVSASPSDRKSVGANWRESMQCYDDSRDYRLALGPWGLRPGAIAPGARIGTFIPLILSAALLNTMPRHTMFESNYAPTEERP